MATTDTDVQQLVINVGTTAQIQAAISGGTITQDMLSVVTDDALTSTDVTTALGYTPAKVNLSNITNNAASALNGVGARTVTSTYISGKNWYRVYSDKWVEQGGFTTDFSGSDSTLTVSLLMALKDENYTVVATSANCGYHPSMYVHTKTTTTFKLRREATSSSVRDDGADWVAYGYKS